MAIHTETLVALKKLEEHLAAQGKSKKRLETFDTDDTPEIDVVALLPNLALALQWLGTKATRPGRVPTNRH